MSLSKKILTVNGKMTCSFSHRGRSPHKRFEGLPKQKKLSWSGSEKDVNTGRESPESCSGTSSNNSEEHHKKKYSIRPPPGSPKKLPAKKINIKNVKSMVNKMEYAEDHCDENVNEEYTDDVTKTENAEKEE